jgi:UTP--glucose-1-phosphate uridylyltransferase
MHVRKAVIPAAGMGTRMLPASLAVPKELLPLVDRPIIHYAVEEAVAAGVTQFVIIIAPGKEALADYFIPAPTLEADMKARGGTDPLSGVRRLREAAQFTYVVQQQQLGLGHAVLMAREAVGDEPFAVLLPDDVILGPSPALGRLLQVAHRYQAGVIAVEEVPRDRVNAYGVINPRELEDGVFEVMGLVEKPSPQEAPSNLGIVGRYVLPPQVFDALERTPPGARGELQLTDAIALLLEGQRIYASCFQGARYDTGTPLGLLQASVALGLERDGLGPALRAWLERLLAGK